MMPVLKTSCLLCFVLSCVFGAKNLCNKSFGNEVQLISHGNTLLRQPLVCKNSQNPISVRIRQLDGTNPRTKVVIRRCPTVNSVWLHFPRNGGIITSARPTNGIITSCNGTNNTFILWQNKRGHRDKYVLGVALHSAEDINFLILTYDLKQNGIKHTLTYKIDLPEQVHWGHFRHKREVTVNNSLLPPGCGAERSCIRFGAPECAHMECKYFVSYRRLGSTDLEIEISGKTSGWVAIGFSSDDKMGGGDDVLVCKRSTQYDEKVEVVSMTNTVQHARPEAKDSNFNLTEVKYKDGYIYCKIIRPLKVNLEGHLDLFNDWYQLYATGDITSTGVMLQHDDIPPTSKNKITVVIPVNIERSMATRMSIGFIVVTMTALVTFYVS